MIPFDKTSPSFRGAGESPRARNLVQKGQLQEQLTAHALEHAITRPAAAHPEGVSVRLWHDSDESVAAGNVRSPGRSGRAGRHRRRPSLTHRCQLTCFT
jgi:hypothetical protein